MPKVDSEDNYNLKMSDVISDFVRLVVKTPNQQFDDQTIEAARNWTVRKLKSHIKEVYPTKPSEERQKLIYSGKLLNDHLKLADFLVVTDHSGAHLQHTVHLVCSPSSNSSENSSPSSTPAPEPEVRRRINEGASTLPQPSMINPNQPYFQNPPYSYYQWQQIMSQPYMMQQMYAQHASRFMQINQAGNPAQNAWPYYQMNNEYASIPATTNENTNEAPQEPVVREPEAPGANPVMNAAGGGGAENDWEEVNNDWLDWLYTASRLALLLSIVYFYSSIGRLIMVIAAFVMIYLYNSGWWNTIARWVAGGNNQPARHQAQPAAAEPERNFADEDTNHEGTERGETPDQPPPPSMLSVAWTFVSTFVTSLIPQQQPLLGAQN